MPELPEVEVVKRSLESKIQNKIIKKVKINDIKFTKQNYDKKKELENLVIFKTNQQLNQLSNIYFKKIKKNTNQQINVKGNPNFT